MTHDPADADEPLPTSSTTSARVWTPYELTQLSRHGQSIPPQDQATEAPVEYLTGHVEFAGLDFVVSRETLIPRIETEELVEMAWKEILVQVAAGRAPSILDVGTGCGAIAICLATRAADKGITLPVIATDVSETAVAVAHENAKRLVPNSDISFLQSDLLTQLPKTVQFSLITANLPYIPSERIAYLESSVKDFEPHVALDGGHDGLRLIYKLLEAAPAVLQPGGKVILEVDYTHTVENFVQFRPKWSVDVVFDTFNRNRFVVAELR